MMKPAAFGFASLDHGDDEQIDVLRIRLWNAQNSSAVLSDFYSAERVLASWAQGNACDAVRFEVSFVDGYILKGCHEFFSKGKRKCMLSAHLRRLMKCMPGGDDYACLPPGRDVSRYLIPAH
jgi:hypothetical protein